MTPQESFQKAVKEALQAHGQNKFGQKHQEHVWAELIAEETGAEAKDIREQEWFKLACKTLNASAFAHWMGKHVKGFKRETKGSKTASIVKGFSLDMEAEK